jgi:hypothetical protein
MATSVESDLAPIIADGAKRLAARILERVAKGTSFPGDGRLDAELRTKLNQDTEALKFDAAHDHAWGDSIKPASPQTTVTIGANYGYQQIGVGDHTSQSISVHAGLADLVKAIDNVLQSPEFAALGEEERRDVQEDADDLIQEAKKASPERQRVEKCGRRVIRRLQAAGLTVAEKALDAALVAGLLALGSPGPAM